MKTKKVKPTAYTAIAKVMGKTYTAEGESVSEAISNLTGLKNARGRLILTIKHGDQARERVLQPNMAFKLSSASKTTRDIALKNLSLLYG